jgi:CO dehydrogenase maturation factor
MLLIVVEPGARSVETAVRVAELSREMGVERMGVVANRVKDAEQEQSLSRLLEAHGLRLMVSLPVLDVVARSDLEGKSPFAMPGVEPWTEAVRRLSKEISKYLGSAGFKA